MGRRFGYIAGGAVGSTAGLSVYGAQKNRDQKALRHYYKDKPYKSTVAKSKAHLITDLGTAAGRAEAKGPKWKRWPKAPVASFAGAGLLAGGATYGLESMKNKGNRRQLDGLYTQQVRREKKAATTPITKAARQTKLERYTATPEENRRARAENSAKLTASTAGVIGVHRGLQHLSVKGVNRARAAEAASYGYPPPPHELKVPKFNKKVALGMLGTAAVAGATGKYHKDQYRVVNKSTSSAFGVDHG